MKKFLILCSYYILCITFYSIAFYTTISKNSAFEVYLILNLETILIDYVKKN